MPQTGLITYTGLLKDLGRGNISIVKTHLRLCSFGTPVFIERITDLKKAMFSQNVNILKTTKP